MLSFTETEKSESVLNLNGYQFTEKQCNKTSNKWRCRDCKCTSVISLCSQGLIIMKDEAQPSPTQDKSKIIIDTTTIYEKFKSFEFDTHKKRKLTKLQLVIKCGRAVKIHME
ncbi:unnamed protein product [Didymodactylos carnosus]|uniref:Uncharacterized protein n=1 Tax=Didymodactylos carnosus TaxID=1234261 RepID=A0A816AUQ1_9BILA|nr:unnamed protein product [Didymodactylos carnosus]CAF1601655.1 unnamed protein product [Didymodactylos carnosus]CAF4401053.1 unnamed protein product [Didymodactylos carnosus]CAF4479222.1 unnamed protein product [Didymodactylos carnosus]